MSRARDFADLAGSADAGGLTGRNLIINGAMQVAQRGTQSSVTSAQYGSCDRFYWFSSAGDTVTLSQDTSAPDGFQNSFKLAITTADSSLGANELARIEQRIEGQNLRHLKYGVSSAESVTLSFYVKTNKTGTYAASIFEETGSNVISKTYTVSSADTWEFKSITFPGLTSASISATNGTGLRIWWGIGAGSNYTGGSNDAWTSGATNWFEGQAVNVLDSTSNTFFLTGVQLEVGEKATPFEHRSFADELQRCKRYYQTHGNEHTSYRYLAPAFCNATTQAQGVLALPVTMRAAPTASVSGNFQLIHGSTGHSITLGTKELNQSSVGLQPTGSSFTANSGAIIRAHDDDTAELKLDAEL